MELQINSDFLSKVTLSYVLKHYFTVIVGNLQEGES